RCRSGGFVDDEGVKDVAVDDLARCAVEGEGGSRAGDGSACAEVHRDLDLAGNAAELALSVGRISAEEKLIGGDRAWAGEVDPGHAGDAAGDGNVAGRQVDGAAADLHEAHADRRRIDDQRVSGGGDGQVAAADHIEQLVPAGGVELHAGHGPRVIERDGIAAGDEDRVAGSGNP